MVVLGAVGLFLPLWPTTPFLLVAAACFSCVPRLKAKLMRIPFVRDHISNYQNRVGLPRKTVIVNLVFLWGILLISCTFVKSVWLMGLLSAVGAAVTVHILHMAKPKNSALGKRPVFKEEQL